MCIHFRFIVVRGFGSECGQFGGEDLLKDAGQTATDFFKGLREKLEESKKP